MKILHCMSIYFAANKHEISSKTAISLLHQWQTNVNKSTHLFAVTVHAKTNMYMFLHR